MMAGDDALSLAHARTPEASHFFSSLMVVWEDFPGGGTR
jgi:hypothetical protein